jgi:hypothetical protein
LSFSIWQLFQYPTIYELAQELKSTETSLKISNQVQPFSLISQEDRLKLPGKIEDAYPLTMLQAGMIFHSEASPDMAMYQNVNSIHVKAPWAPEKIHQAIKQLMDRHPVMRTSFDLSNFTELMQLVHSAVAVPLQVDDLRHLSPFEQEEAVDSLMEAEKHRKFVWTQAPLLRFFVHRRSEDTFQFTWTEHHSILDGWSLASMIAELFQHYFSLLGEELDPIEPPPTVEFKDFVALEKKALESEDCQKFWTQKLSGYTMTNIPRWTSS